MQDFPHHYRVTAAGGRDGDVTLTSPGLEPIRSMGPAEFGGPGDLWSPETLLVAAVADCFVLSFRAVARAARFDWQNVDIDVDGRLERVDGVTQFTVITERVTLEIADAADEGKAKKLLEKAGRSCLITNSMTAETRLETEIRRASPAAVT